MLNFNHGEQQLGSPVLRLWGAAIARLGVE